MQQVADFTPQAYTPGPQSQSGASLSEQPVVMGRHIAQQASTAKMTAAPLSDAGGDQALPARDVSALPSGALDSLLLQSLTGPVQSLWVRSRFNVDSYQRAVGLEVQRLVVKDAFEDLLQAGVVEINAQVSDKMQALCDRLVQLRHDHELVQQRLEMLSDGEISHRQSERPVLPEKVVVSQAPLEFALPEKIQPQHSDTVESEVVPHILERSSGRMADIDSGIVVLDEPSTATSTSTLEADAKFLDDFDQRLSVLSKACNELGQRLDQYSAEQGPRHQELEDKLTSLHHRCDELRGSSTNSESRHRAEIQNLIEHHYQELEARGAAYREEIADLQARYQDQIGILQRELQDSHERVEKLNESIHEDDARLQASPALTDVEANELREAVALRNKEFALLTEQYKMLQLRYDTLVASHQVDTDKVTSAHQSELEELQSIMRRRDQDISDLRGVVESYKSTLSQKSDLVAINESTLADFNAQLMATTEVAENLVKSFNSVHGKHSEVQDGLGVGCEQLAEIVIMAKGLTEELAEHKLAAELTSMLGECSTHFASTQKTADDLQRELDGISDVLSSSQAVFVEPESSTADESDIARTYASVNRREVQV